MSTSEKDMREKRQTGRQAAKQTDKQTKSQLNRKTYSESLGNKE